MKSLYAILVVVIVLLAVALAVADRAPVLRPEKDVDGKALAACV